MHIGKYREERILGKYLQLWQNSVRNYLGGSTIELFQNISLKHKILSSILEIQDSIFR